jgi:hypothetical protein
LQPLAGHGHPFLVRLQARKLHTQLPELLLGQGLPFVSSGDKIIPARVAGVPHLVPELGRLHCQLLELQLSALA